MKSFISAQVLSGVVVCCGLVKATALPPSCSVNVKPDTRTSTSINSTATTCINPSQRKAWHTLANTEKKSYIDAVLCLMSAPTTSGFDGSQSLWDDLTYVHRVNTNIIHNNLLREQCNYTGYQPYWETVRDVGHVIEASILDPVTGFGGNGTGEDLHVPNGPFKDVVLHLGPKYTNTDHCLSRNINELVAVQNCSQANIGALFTYDNFTAVYDLFGNSIHTGGHSAIRGTGGVMTDLINSPNPLFFLHHANLDHIWNLWQRVDPTNCLYAIGGPNIPADYYISSRGLLNVTASQSDYFSDNGTMTTTLNHNLDLVGMMVNRTISEVMDTKGSLFCYEYV